MKTKEDTIGIIKKELESVHEFPVMSHTLNLVSRQADAKSDATVTQLTDTILHDFALTNKILKIANTAHYIKSTYGGKINTVSRAVYILGLDHIRNAALSLMLFDNLNNKNLVKELKNVMMTSFISAILARELALALEKKNTEEAFLCSMFYDFGKILSTFYLPGDSTLVRELISKRGVNEGAASFKIFGISYEKLGMVFAKEWQFSNQIVYCMQRYNQPKVPRPTSELDMLRCIVNFSNELCAIANSTDNDQELWKSGLNSLIEKYKDCFSISAEQIIGIVQKAQDEILDYARDFNINLSQISFVKTIKGLLDDKGTEKKNEEKAGDPRTKLAKSVKDSAYGGSNGVQVLDMSSQSTVDDDPMTIFARGVQEVATALIEDISLNDILRMILEIMFRGLGTTRIIICIKTPKDNIMEARFGFGEDVMSVITRFKFVVDIDAEDIFNKSLTDGADLLINDINEARVKARIPGWYRNLLDSETFLLFPIKINKIPLGIIYTDKPFAGELQIEPKILRYLKTLRDQAILAVKQKYK
ncbi:HDOD domain-containing protein [Candidatus Magnetobacterium casense]|uniref:HDOD domain-containing protein n=1 Tax=Candidatus Magnetobacterium casense TaxID=1455061 RepID=A0ABS6S0I1_9BACT|nr:HDOD domain-containing protein [Candidatus Magnetobacterium casensis]MBV6341898.1 HDOD domain-containing protein [Candidatus Magnetobacterium casensis]